MSATDPDRGSIEPVDFVRDVVRRESVARDPACDCLTFDRGHGPSAYRELTQDDEVLFRLFRRVTPVDALAKARFGSRPAYRPGAKEGVGGIRAIPWVFGWTQMRLMLPGWLGARTALGAYLTTAGGLDRLQRMARRWPFFDDLLSKIEMVCANADMKIARLYVEQLGGDVRLFERLNAEYDATSAGRMTRRPTVRLTRAIPSCRRP